MLWRVRIFKHTQTGRLIYQFDFLANQMRCCVLGNDSSFLNAAYQMTLYRQLGINRYASFTKHFGTDTVDLCLDARLFTSIQVWYLSRLNKHIKRHCYIYLNCGQYDCQITVKNVVAFQCQTFLSTFRQKQSDFIWLFPKPNWRPSNYIYKPYIVHCSVRPNWVLYLYTFLCY